MSRITLKKLICDGLGYCCEFSFFKLHRRTALIAARLGVTERAVRYHKAQFRRGEFQCCKAQNCLKGKLV